MNVRRYCEFSGNKTKKLINYNPYLYISCEMLLHCKRKGENTAESSKRSNSKLIKKPTSGGQMTLRRRKKR